MVMCFLKVVKKKPPVDANIRLGAFAFWGR
jgi:hypothetical protein